MFPTSYGQALNNAGYQQAMDAQLNGSAYNAQNAYNANQQRLAAEQAWNAQQQAAAPATYSNRVELEKELAYNENEIRYLQNQLENMRAEWMDQDSFDRKLAANRAAIGDFANSRAHQNDIIARQNDRNRVADTAMQWRWQAAQNKIAREADQKKQAKANIQRLIGEIEDIDAQIPYHTEVGAANALRAKKARLLRELAGYGVSVGVQEQAGNTDASNVVDSVATLRQDEASATNEKGFFKDAEQREKIAKRYDELGLKAEAKRVRAIKTVGEKKKGADDFAAEKKEADKIALRYTGLTPEQFANFKQKWNAGTDPEIKKLKKHYDLDFKTGALTAKKR